MHDKLGLLAFELSFRSFYLRFLFSFSFYFRIIRATFFVSFRSMPFFVTASLAWLLPFSPSLFQIYNLGPGSSPKSIWLCPFRKDKTLHSYAANKRNLFFTTATIKKANSCSRDANFRRFRLESFRFKSILLHFLVAQLKINKLLTTE